MTRYLTLVIGLCVLSLAAVALISPSPEEKVERALSRLAPPDALAELGRIYELGYRSPTLLLQRTELLLAAGDFDEARRTLASLAATPGGALLSAESLARLELDLGDLRAAIPHLARAYALEPTPERLDRLARLHELARETEKELAVLEDLNPADLTERSAARLLELRLVRGEMAGVERLLRARAETAGAARGTMRGALVELLVGSDRADVAAGLAANWFARDGDSDALALAAERLIERGLVTHAKVLAEAAVASGLPGAHVVIPVFAIAGHGLAARTLLRDWLEANPQPDADGKAALLKYAETMNDYSTAREMLRRGMPDDFDTDFVLGVLEGSYRRFGIAALTEFRRYMVPEILSAHPLFAAEIAIARRESQDALRFLKIAVARDLLPWERTAAEGLARQINADPSLLRSIRTQTSRTALQ